MSIRIAIVAVGSVALFGSAVPPAFGCSVLSPGLERQAAHERARELARADRVIVGDWSFDPESEENANSGLRTGTVTTRATSRRAGRSYRVLTRQEITCGFPLYPREGEVGDARYGRFYLRRERDSYFYRLIHFESLEPVESPN